MKRIVASLSLALSALALASCASDPPPTQVHHYHTRTRYVEPSYKPAGVSGSYNTNVYSNSPEGFSAVAPPHSYSN
jgi:hypothetical protein